MSDFRKFLEADQPPAPGLPGGDMGDAMGGMDQIPGGMGGAPLPMGGDMGGPPMGGDPMGVGMDPMGAPAPTKTLEIKPVDVWDLLEKILGMKKSAQDEMGSEPESDNSLEQGDLPR